MKSNRLIRIMATGRTMRSAAWLCVLLALGLAAALAAEPSAAKPVTVLDLQSGSFRAFLAWRTSAEVSGDGKVKPLLEKPYRGMKEGAKLRSLPVRGSAGPSADWASTAFNDGGWARMHAGVAVQSGAGWDRVWLRGKFKVEAPAQVKGLTLVLSYRGGIIVFVNGLEIHRAHLPAGDVGPRTFAAGYPDEAYLRPDGKRYAGRDGRKFPDRMATRTRKIAELAIPSKTLREGLNVLAIQCVGAPINEKACRAKEADTRRPPALFAHGGLLAARLQCEPGGAIEPNVGPSAAITIGNVPPAGTLLVDDYACAADSLNAVELIGAKNGYFSGRVILSSSGTIRAPKATATDLSQEGGSGKIPSSAVMIRWSSSAPWRGSWLPKNRFDHLYAEPPKQVEPLSVQLRGQKRKPAPAALVPIWLTVKVPRAASAGVYKGSVVIEAEGTAPVKFTVPVTLNVHDWTVPDSKDFFLVNNILHSPDSVARYYEVPLWSEKHFKLMEQSLSILEQVGSRICVLNLVAKAHSHGNTESIVRWIKQADGSYKYDFSLAEKYMDLFEKTCGKPRILEVTAWCFQGDNPKKPKWPQHAVTVFDANGKKLPDMLQPPYGSPENAAFWKPVLTGLRKRLEKRGWWDVTCLGWLDYCNPPRAPILDVARSIWPDGQWIKNAHAPSSAFKGKTGSMPVKYSAYVWGAGGLYDPDRSQAWAKAPVYHKDGRKTYPCPWKPKKGSIRLGIPRLGVAFTRPGLYNQSPLIRLRTVPEALLQGGLSGLGMVGGDFWPIKMGRRHHPLCDNRGGVGPKNNTLAMVVPGPEGPVFSERLEAFREGLQIAEAIVFLQKAMETKTLGDDLTLRIKNLLDERARQYRRNCTPTPKGPGRDAEWMTLEATAWQARDAQLLALAGRVSKVMRGKK